MLTVYGIPNCDTVKKARTWLEQHDIAYIFHDYKKQGVPVAHLQSWLKQKGWEVIINRRGPTFRKIPAERTAQLDNTIALELLQEFPSAIKRPIVEHGTVLLVGFDAADWQQQLR